MNFPGSQHGFGGVDRSHFGRRMGYDSGDLPNLTARLRDLITGRNGGAQEGETNMMRTLGAGALLALAGIHARPAGGGAGSARGRHCRRRARWYHRRRRRPRRRRRRGRASARRPARSSPRKRSGARAGIIGGTAAATTVIRTGLDARRPELLRRLLSAESPVRDVDGEQPAQPVAPPGLCRACGRSRAPAVRCRAAAG